MPKLKTKKSVIKRFKVTATGKLLHRATNKGHFNAKQTGKQRRARRKFVPVAKSDLKNLKRLLPYHY